LLNATGNVSGSTDSTANGLNQLASIGGGAPGYDDRGNLTYDPVTGRYFGYWSEGELVAASGGYGFGRDAFSRLIDTYANGFVGERFVYDGAEIVAETDGANIAGRYVRGDGPDELLAAYLTADPSSRRLVHADERGSVIAYTDSGGNATAINRYDEFGNPQTGNWGRFQSRASCGCPRPASTITSSEPTTRDRAASTSPTRSATPATDRTSTPMCSTIR
jgi:hypothetical protein